MLRKLLIFLLISGSSCGCPNPPYQQTFAHSFRDDEASTFSAPPAMSHHLRPSSTSPGFLNRPIQASPAMTASTTATNSNISAIPGCAYEDMHMRSRKCRCFDRMMVMAHGRIAKSKEVYSGWLRTPADFVEKDQCARKHVTAQHKVDTFHTGSSYASRCSRLSWSRSISALLERLHGHNVLATLSSHLKTHQKVAFSKPCIWTTIQSKLFKILKLLL